MRRGVKLDGEFYLRVNSRILQVRGRPRRRRLASGVLPSSHLFRAPAQVYCADMNTDFPKEYVTLRSGQMDNYSEVYGHRWVCGGARGPAAAGALTVGMSALLFQAAEPFRVSVQRQQEAGLQLQERLRGGGIHPLPQGSAGPGLSEDNGCVDPARPGIAMSNVPTVGTGFYVETRALF